MISDENAPFFGNATREDKHVRSPPPPSACAEKHINPHHGTRTPLFLYSTLLSFQGIRPQRFHPSLPPSLSSSTLTIIAQDLSRETINLSTSDERTEDRKHSRHRSSTGSASRPSRPSPTDTDAFMFVDGNVLVILGDLERVGHPGQACFQVAQHYYVELRQLCSCPLESVLAVDQVSSVATLGS